MTACKYGKTPTDPGCGVDTDARPYARSGIPSVTTIIDLANFDSKARRFAWSAGERSAVKAVHESMTWWELPMNIGGKPCRRDHKLCGLCGLDKMTEHWPKDGSIARFGADGHKFVPGLCPACSFLRSQWDWQTTEKATLGTHVHHLAASWARGEDVESDAVTDPYLDGLAVWYEQFHPQFIAVEQTVHYAVKPREYVGSFDLLVEHDCTCPLAQDFRCLGLYDIKTGIGQWDKEWVLQISAYRYAKSFTSWERGQQTITGAMPTVAHTGVLWLKDTGVAEVVPVDTNAEAHNQFLRLLDLWNWQKRVDKELAEIKEASGATVGIDS